MTKEFFISREKGGERALLVQLRIFHGEHHDHFDEALSEFKSLVLSAAVKIIDVVIGKMNSPHPKYFVGDGKAQEIAELVKAHDIETVIFNHALSPHCITHAG